MLQRSTSLVLTWAMKSVNGTSCSSPSFTHYCVLSSNSFQCEFSFCTVVSCAGPGTARIGPVYFQATHGDRSWLFVVAISLTYRISAVSAFCWWTTHPPNKQSLNCLSHKASYSSFSFQIGCHGHLGFSFLWPPYVIGQDIDIFILSFFLFLA